MKNTMIYKCSNGDTRFSKENVTFEEFQLANDMHIQDVRNVMNNIALEIMNKGNDHDFTKKSEEELFYKDSMNSKGFGNEFKEAEWFNLHINSERHHLNNVCPDDVNLLDIIEMLVDCVCAGKARSGHIFPIELSSEILTKAVNNTVDMIKESITVNDSYIPDDSKYKTSILDDIDKLEKDI